MRVLILCPGSDLAGVGIGIKRAFDKHSDFEVRQVRRVPWRYGYEHDAEWEQRDELIRWADLLHVMETPGDYAKPTVYHHHGSYFRTHGGPPGICSTLDLELLGAGEWLPSPVDIDSLQKVASEKNAGLTVAHAGTWPEAKSTQAFLDAAARLPLNVLHIQGVTHSECMRLQATADIYFDQVLTGMGQNAVQAMSMGIPVIAGIEPAEARKRGHQIPDETPDHMLRRWGEFPFLRVTEDTIYDALVQLMDRSERVKWADIGLAHVRRFHDERVVVRQLEDIYRRAVS